MTQERFEFLKGVAGYFRDNPQATNYLGVSRQTCFSLLALHFSDPTEILDPTTPDFLTKAQEKVHSFGENLEQNQPLPQTTPLVEGVEDATKKWQEGASRLTAKNEPAEKTAEKMMKFGAENEWVLKAQSLRAWKKIDPKLADQVKWFSENPLKQMDAARLDLLRGITAHFQGNPKATQYQGISRESCFSLVGIQLSDQQAILDPSSPEFLTQAAVKINLFEENLKQGQPLPQTVALPQKTEEVIQKWQDSIAKAGPSLPPKTVEKEIKGHSFQAWQRINPKLASKINWFLKNPLTKAGGVVGFALMATFFSAAIIKKALKYLGIPLYFLYNLFAALGTAALVGFTAGAVAGGLAGGVAGAIFGAKLGVAIGFAVGGPIGAVIGGILGGLVGFTVGALGGALIGGAVFGSLGYAIEHWVWQPVQNFWAGAGNFLGGAGGFFGGLFGGLGSAMGGLLSAIGGAATATGSFLAGFATQLSTLSAAPLITAPFFVTLGAAFGFTFWLNTDIVGTAFMRQPLPSAETKVPPGAQYATLAKNGVFTRIGEPIKYTLTVTAKEKVLTNVQITDQTTFSCASNPPSVPPRSLGPYSVAPGAPLVLDYQTATNDQFRDCLVINTAAIRFDILEAGVTGQTLITSFALTIGTPPTTSCPIIGGTISCGSYNAGCHCQPGIYSYACDPSRRERYAAIDVVGPGGRDTYDVYLPTIFGETLQWKYEFEESVSNGVFWGWRKQFRAESISGKEYKIRLLHIEPGNPPLTPGAIYPSGTRVANLYDNLDGSGLGHTHVTVAEGGEYKDADLYFRMCL